MNFIEVQKERCFIANKGIAVKFYAKAENFIVDYSFECICWL